MGTSKDAVFKILLRSYLKNKADIITEHEISTANLRIDFVLKDLSEEIRKYAPFSHFPKNVVGEFKSPNDFFAVSDFYMLPGKLLIFISENNELDSQKTGGVFIISGRKHLPKKIKEKYKVHKLSEGIYRIDTILFKDLYLILSEKIELNEGNYYLGFFTESNFDNFIDIAISLKDTFILTLGYILFKNRIEKSEKAMATLNTEGYTIREAIEGLGIKRVVNEVGMNRVIEEIGIDRVIEEIGIGKVIEEIGIDRVIEEIGIDKVIKEIEFNEIMDKYPDLFRKQIKKLSPKHLKKLMEFISENIKNEVE